ncbi:MAG: hypothetical protein IKI57_02260 [Clostridia bacterium]|nr:hypothetical protein [Clostridia bacterium]
MEKNEPKKKLMRSKTFLLFTKIFVYIIPLVLGIIMICAYLSYKLTDIRVKPLSNDTIPFFIIVIFSFFIAIIQIVLSIVALIKKNYSDFMMVFDFATGIIFALIFDVVLFIILFSQDPVFMYLASAILVIKALYSLDFVVKTILKLKNNELNDREREKVSNQIIIYNIINVMISTFV